MPESLSMGVLPESHCERPVDFRAPPPSPVASGRRSCVTNDDVLTEFLETSLRVPELVLPDKIFPKQKFIDNPSRIDLGSLGVVGKDCASSMLESIARIGCFQLVNHGVPCELLQEAMVAASGIFEVSPEKRATAMRSPEKSYGFEEVRREEDGEESRQVAEEFVWCRDDEGLKLDMERLWPVGYSNFSHKMAELQSDIDRIAETVLAILCEKCLGKSACRNDWPKGDGHSGTVCSILRHSKDIARDCWASSLRYDVIRMLIRGADYSHALCLHICDGASEFHVYSKRGWVSFCPDENSLIVTVGDQFQAMSDGQYKHVVGRPIFECKTEDRISMSFLYSPSRSSVAADEKHCEGRNTVSIGQQLVVAMALTLLYQLLVYMFKRF